MRAGRQALDRLPILEDRDHARLIFILLIAAEAVSLDDLSRDALQVHLVLHLNWLAARAVARCSAIARSKPSMSTSRPRSRAMSAVRSTGKP